MATTNGADHANGDYTLNKQATHENVLSQVRTAGTVSIPPELFEKLYLSPENRVKGNISS